MKKVYNKIYSIIDKIGKQNFILVVFVIIVLIISGLYQTFSLYTSNEGYSIVDDLKTYKFILSTSLTTNSVTIASGTSKNIAITISNSEERSLKYGIYYSTKDDLTDVSLGYLSTSEYESNGTIEANQDYIITIRIDNNSTNNITIDLGLSYGLETGGDLVLKSNQHWLEQMPEYELLSEKLIGEYVAYEGANGCDKEACNGKNANNLNNFSKGYCSNSNYEYSYSGWRIAYISDNIVYLISAGAPECVNTYLETTSTETHIQPFTPSSDNIPSSFYWASGVSNLDITTGQFTLTGLTANATNWSSSNYHTLLEQTPYTCKKTANEATCEIVYKVTSGTDTQATFETKTNFDNNEGVPTHLTRLNELAQKYCNPTYSYGGKCDSDNAWAMGSNDFKKIVGNELNTNSCYNQMQSTTCGYNNELIDIGGDYWYGVASQGNIEVGMSNEPITIKAYGAMYWAPDAQKIYYDTSNNYHGLRPVIKLKESVKVKSGSGTESDPYILTT